MLLERGLWTMCFVNDEYLSDLLSFSFLVCSCFVSCFLIVKSTLHSCSLLSEYVFGPVCSESVFDFARTQDVITFSV
jgi:hypothetical protein